MSSVSESLSMLLAFQQNNYLSVGLLAAIGYDFILLLPKEIEFVWNKPWTWVSTLYILARYCGLYNAVYAALFISSFISVVEIFEGTILNDIERWTYLVFLGAADVIMILRVWAMYNRSRMILGLLLVGFIVEVIFIVVYAAFYTNPKNEQYIILHVEGYSFCFGTPSGAFGVVSIVSQIVFAAVLCISAILRFVRISSQMYHATKQWQPTRYIGHLVRQGILYFFIIFLMNLMNLLWDTGKIPGSGWSLIIAAIVEIVPVFTLTPRFIISIREMYAHDVQARRKGIDTGFGLSAKSSRGDVIGGITLSSGMQSGATMSGLDDSEEMENIELVPKQSSASVV